MTLKNNSIYFLCFFLLLLLYLSSCSKSDQVQEDTKPPAQTVVLATLTTTELHSVTTINAMGGGMITNDGGGSVTERGIVVSTQSTPTVSDIKFGTTSVSGNGSFTCSLNGLTASTKYYVRAYAVNAAGIAYGNEVAFTTAAINAASFAVDDLFIIGNSLAHWDVEVLTDGGDAITERGVCWSLSANPTIDDFKSKNPDAGLGKFRGTLTNLSPRTEYYVRAYAKNAKGYSYSNSVKFKTIGKGNLTYTFNKSSSPSAAELEAYARLQAAIDSAVWYVNNYTSVTKHVWLNYVPGVPTADANNEGWMRFGSNAGFHNIRTMLHELNHTFGTGTTNWWSSKLVGGKLQATNTNIILNQIQKTTNSQLSGDSQHWWPYGLNQNSEVTSSWDYVYNCLIIEQMRKDGLPAAGTWVD